MKLPERYTAWLTITRGCQLRCDWCYAKETEYSIRMSDSVLKDSLEMLSGLPVKTVCLIGGEPTTDSRFIEIVSVLKKRGYHVSVISNGIRFANSAFLDKAIEAGIGNIIVSLKSAHRDGYVADTGRDAYDTVMSGLLNLKARKNDVKYTLSVTLCGSGIRNVDALFESIRLSGTTSISFDTERPIIVNNEVEYGGLEPKMTVEMLVSLYDRMESLVAAGIDYHVYITHPFCLFPEWYICRLRETGRLVSGCQLLGGKGIIIDELGRIVPCNHFCTNALGSINECKTGDAYLAWRRQKHVSGFYERMSGYPAIKCLSCQQWQFCGAGCRINWFKYGEGELLPSNL